MSIETSIEKALFSRVTSLDLDGAPPIAWPNFNFEPPENAPYIQVLLFPNRNTRLLVKGAAPHLRQGILQLTVVAPLHKGTTDATTLAGQIAEHFPADLDLFEGGVRVRIQAAPHVMPADRTDVSWDVSVGIPFEALA